MTSLLSKAAQMLRPKVQYSWFECENSQNGYDILRVIQAPSPPTKARASQYETLCIDLRAGEDAVWSGFDRNTKYEVRRAGKESVAVDESEHLDTDALNSFVVEYDRFRSEKSLAQLNMRLLEQLQAQGRLSLTVSRCELGHPMSWHVYVVRGERARLLHSITASTGEGAIRDRSYVGRANRLHHWKDITRFMGAGLTIYDLGGWYSGSTDSAKMGINKFKESFGGVHEVSWNYDLPLNGLGFSALKADGVRRSMRGILSR